MKVHIFHVGGPLNGRVREYAERPLPRLEVIPRAKPDSCVIRPESIEVQHYRLEKIAVPGIGAYLVYVFEGIDETQVLDTLLESARFFARDGILRGVFS